MATALLPIMALGVGFDFGDESPTTYRRPYLHGTQVVDSPDSDLGTPAVPGQNYLDIYGLSWAPEYSQYTQQNQARQANSIAYDSEGNIIVTGWYAGVIAYANCATIYPVPPGAGQFKAGACLSQGTSFQDPLKYPSDIFVAKINGRAITPQSQASIDAEGVLDMAIEQPNAVLMWLYSFGGDDDEAPTSEDAGYSVVTIGTDIYVAGCYTGLGTFGSFTKTSTNENDAFVMKLNSAGTVQWVQSGGSTGSKALNGECALALAADSTDPSSIYVAGYFEGTFTFGGITASGKVNAMNAFVSKMRVLDGTGVWIKGFVGDENSDNAAASDKAYARGLAAYDNCIYVTGDFLGKLAELGEILVTVSTVGAYDIFLVKLDEIGTVVSLKSYGGDSVPSGDEPQTTVSKGTALAIQKSTKKVFLVGSFQGVINVLNSAGFSYTGNKGEDEDTGDDEWVDTPFVLALNSALEPLWMNIIESTGVDNPEQGMLGSTATGVAVGEGCAVDLFVTGAVSGPTAKFGDLQVPQGSGMYVWQMTTDGSSTNYYVYETFTLFYSNGWYWPSGTGVAINPGTGDLAFSGWSPQGYMCPTGRVHKNGKNFCIYRHPQDGESQTFNEAGGPNAFGGFFTAGGQAVSMMLKIGCPGAAPSPPPSGTNGGGTNGGGTNGGGTNGGGTNGGGTNGGGTNVVVTGVNWSFIMSGDVADYTQANLDAILVSFCFRLYGTACPAGHTIKIEAASVRITIFIPAADATAQQQVQTQISTTFPTTTEVQAMVDGAQTTFAAGTATVEGGGSTSAVNSGSNTVVIGDNTQIIYTTSQARKDPHLHFADGGRADFRGADGKIFNFLSARNVSLNVRIVSADFRWVDNPKYDATSRLIHGTKMEAAFWNLRTTANRRVLLSYGINSPAVAKVEVATTQTTSTATCALRFFSHKKACSQSSTTWTSVTMQPGDELTLDNVRIQLQAKPKPGVKVVVKGKWELIAMVVPMPFGTLNAGQTLLDLESKALYDADHDPVAPHGLFGQSFDGDDLTVEGKRDSYRNGPAEMNTTAQAEGAIEGEWTDYMIKCDPAATKAGAHCEHATTFKFSRFDKKGAKPRDVSRLIGVKRRRNATAPMGMSSTRLVELAPDVVVLRR